MTTVPRTALVAVFLRSFTVQGSWNYKTLIGGGFGFALLPVLRRIYADDPEGLRTAVARHSQLFNSHPYLAPMALGAVATLETAHENPLVIERFKAAVRGSLGTLGDRLVWAGVRPVTMLAALVLFFVGAPWWIAVAAFLILYNAAHIAIRLWAFRIGLKQAKSVGEQLKRHPIGNLYDKLSALGAFFAGAMIPLIALQGIVFASLPLVWLGVAALGAAVGARFGPRVRTPVVIAIGVFSVIGLIIGAVR